MEGAYFSFAAGECAVSAEAAADAKAVSARGTEIPISLLQLPLELQWRGELQLTLEYSASK